MSVMRHCLLLLLLGCALSGCIHVKMDPIEVHAVVDVNVKVDKAVDDFFGDLDKKSTTVATPGTSRIVATIASARTGSVSRPRR